MKVFVHFEDCLEDEHRMTVKLALPKKWLAGPAERVLNTFVEAYNKKHPDSALEEAEVHFERKDGTVVPFDAPVASFLKDEEDIFVKAGPSRSMAALNYKTIYETEEAPPASQESKPAKSVLDMAAARAAADAKLNESEPSSQSGAAAAPPSAKAKRCKRFGCNKTYEDASNDAKSCRHHVKPPVFHETRKFWSCCPEQVAWDWESFQAIPGCQVGTHSEQAQEQQFLGGTEMRKEQEMAYDLSTPQKISTGALDNLSALRRALQAIGVKGETFDIARNRAQQQVGGSDPEKVWDNVAMELARRIDAALQAE